MLHFQLDSFSFSRKKTREKKTMPKTVEEVRSVTKAAPRTRGPRAPPKRRSAKHKNLISKKAVSDMVRRQSQNPDARIPMSETSFHFLQYIVRQHIKQVTSTAADLAQ